MILQLAVENKDKTYGMYMSLDYSGTDKELYNVLKDNKYYWYKIFIQGDGESPVVLLNNGRKHFICTQDKIENFYYTQKHGNNNIGLLNNKLLKQNKVGSAIYILNRERFIKNSDHHELSVEKHGIDFNVPPCDLDEIMRRTLQNISMMK